MAIVFPSSPSIGQTFTADGKTWQWNGSRWSGFASSTSINADTVDGIQASQFLRSDTSDTMNGNLTITGNLTVDTNTLFVDAANNNVGIGTNSPADTNGFTRALDLNGVNGAAYYARTNGSATNVTLFANFGSDGYVNNVGAGNLRFYNNGNVERMRITSTGNVGIGTTNPTSTLDVSGTGAIKVPVGSTAQRPTAATGQLRFNSTAGSFEGYNGSAWGSIGGGATGGGGDQVFVENDQTVTANYTIPASKNALTTGPININSGVVVTISSGARWVII